MSKLDDFSNEELQSELNRRKRCKSFVKKCCYNCGNCSDYHRKFVYDFHSYSCDVTNTNLDEDSIHDKVCDKWCNK